MHALLASLIMLAQVFWCARGTKAAYTTEAAEREERNQLLPAGNPVDKAIAVEPTTPSIPCLVAIGGITAGGVIAGLLVWAGKLEWLDWLYFASTMKLFISVVKYLPQVFLNWRLRSVEGFAIGQILLVSCPFFIMMIGLKCFTGLCWISALFRSARNIRNIHRA